MGRAWVQLDFGAMRQLVALAATLFAFFMLAAPARAAGERVSLGEPCVLVTDANAQIGEVLKQQPEFDCRPGFRMGENGTYWALFRALDLRSDPRDPLLFLHAISNEEEEAVWFITHDGRRLASPTSHHESRQILGTAEARYAFPDGANPISAILVRTHNLRNARGVIPRATVQPRSGAQSDHASFRLIYGLLGGAVGVLLLYNLLLFGLLRYRFLMWYCLSLVSVIAFGFTWSGALYWLFPEISAADMVRANLFTIGFAVFMAPRFEISFLGPDCAPRWMIRLLLIVSCLPLAATLVRYAEIGIPWRLTDLIAYGSIFATAALLVLVACTALHRRIAAARAYLLAWMVPVVLVCARALWGLGFRFADNTLFDLSPFFAMTLESVVMAVAVMLRINGLLREREAALQREQQLIHLAESDPLTDLLNRRAFVGRARANSVPMRLLLLDIDRFKSINDCFGHQVGDDTLVHLAGLLRRNAPENALIGRMGGEEFAVMVRADQAAGLAETIRRAVAASPFPGGVIVTISIGFALGRCDSEDHWRGLYAAADEALYSAKRGGRNRVSEQRLIAVPEAA
jgi:diguanylate cyclase (GGDEF)-like protein